MAAKASRCFGQPLRSTSSPREAKPVSTTYHNNSISQMNNLGGLPTAQQLQFAQTEHMSGAETLTKHMQAQRIGSHATTQQNFNTQVLNKSFLSSGTSGTVRRTAGRPVSKTGLAMASNASAGDSHKRQRIVASGSTQDEILNSSVASKQQAKQLMTQQHPSSQKFSGAKALQARNDKKFASQNPSGKAKALQNLAALHHAVSTTTGTTNQTTSQLLSGKTFQHRKYAPGQGPPSQAGKRKRRSSITQRKKKSQQAHLNFEQIQQQLEGGMSIGGFDLAHPPADLSVLTDEQLNGSLVLHHQSGSNDSGLMLHSFLPPRKNYMPKTTGSQAQLIHTGAAASKTKVPSLKDLYSLTSKLSKQRRK